MIENFIRPSQIMAIPPFCSHFFIIAKALRAANGKWRMAGGRMREGWPFSLNSQLSTLNTFFRYFAVPYYRYGKVKMEGYEVLVFYDDLDSNGRDDILWPK